ncbi:MAG: hypothetical protein HYW57_08900 [Ignavibacteriales bacterium]|nr:hypothetical protein [Ignavibacteriales bacterium]
MRTVPVLLCLSVLSISEIFPQSLDLSRTTFSASGEWLIPHREFGEFWNSGPGLGVRAETPLSPTLFLIGNGRFSWFQRAESVRKGKIPHILLITLGLGLQSQARIFPDLLFSADLSLANNTFVFLGLAAPDDIDNAVESEFGFQGSVQIRSPGIGFFISYQHIFAGLDPVAVTSLGVFIPLQ